MSEDEFDNLPDLFANVTEAEWSRVLDIPAAPSTTIQRVHGVSPSRSTTSTDYGDDNFMDPDALAEIDRIEASLSRVASTSRVDANSTANGYSMRRHDSLTPINNSAQSHYLSHENLRPALREVQTSVACPTETTKRQATKKRSRSKSTESPVVKKGKTRAIDKLECVLESYGEELCCPICCDLFVATHLGNPCGHSYCGDCAWQWLNKSDHNECPICRAKLVGDAPLIPNITLDSLIEKHVELLTAAGDIDWQPRGSKYKERVSRKAKWKASADARLKALKVKQKRKEVIFVPSDNEDLSYIEYSSQETGQIGMGRVRSNRRPRNSRQRRR